MRRTIAREVCCEGTALHAGCPVRARLLPADPHTGIIFRREDLGNASIPALYDRVSETTLGTVISDGDASVAVIEHLLAAISGAGIDDLVVSLDGPEPPILDGDSLSWLELLDKGGVAVTDRPRHAIRITQPVEVTNGPASAALRPADVLRFDFEVSFPASVIGTQHLSWTFSPEAFRRDIAPARTFGFVRELEQLRSAGLARGASLDNTLAIDGDRLLNAHLLRFDDEFVRHKILDAMGDMGLAGAPLIGRFEGKRSGHALNNQLLRALFADRANYEIVTAG